MEASYVVDYDGTQSLKQGIGVMMVVAEQSQKLGTAVMVVAAQ